MNNLFMECVICIFIIYINRFHVALFITETINIELSFELANRNSNSNHKNGKLKSTDEEHTHTQAYAYARCLLNVCQFELRC